jgi:probable F420-dependent oxidoreductase
VKVGLMFASTVFTTAEECAEAVAVAESVGIESIWAVEHVLTPLERSSPYPYTSDGNVTGLQELNLCDPVVWLSFVAGLSRTLHLGTCVMILPQRNPAIVAKEWATLDRLSGGRAIMGVGVGWLREEMEALGVPFEERGARTDESIAAIRSLWQDGPSSFEGRYYHWKDMFCNPKPMQKPGIPIHIGGHSPAAARRVARMGDGFLWPGQLSKVTQSVNNQAVKHQSGGDQALRDMLSAIRAECAAIGRDPDSIELSVGASGADPDDLRRLRDLGVSRLMIGVGKRDFRRRLEAFQSLVQSIG